MRLTTMKIKPGSFILLLLALVLTACEQPQPQPEAEAEGGELTLYSGRGESLVDPLIERFQAETGITVNVRYGGTSQLAVALAEEGDQTNADLYWAQDGGALGAVHAAGLFASLPDSLTGKAPAPYRNADGTWVATSGRARALAYAPARVDTNALPQSVFDLTDPAYQGRVAWAPANGSFQAAVTAMRKLVGEDSTRQWLEAMRDNGAKPYPRNSAIVQAIADGEVDYGLPNHYYLLRFKSEDANYPVEQTYFGPGDPGNLVNVAGIGILKNSARQAAALRFVSYLLSADAQQYFASDTKEYPMIEGVEYSPGLPALRDLEALQPQIDLESLDDLEATLAMLRDVGLL